MKYILSTLSFIILLISSISAQYKVLKPQELVIQAKKDAIPVNFDFFKLNLQNTKPANNDIRTYTILELNEKKFKNLSSGKDAFIQFNIPVSKEKIVTLELVEVFPFTSDFILREAPSMKVIQHEKGKFYRGVVQGEQGSIAAISIIQGEISGIISSPSGQGNLILEKNTTDNNYILYNDQQLSKYNKRACSTPDYQTEYTKEELRDNTSINRSLSDCVRVYFEADYDIYQEKGSSIKNVNAFITGIFNQVSTLYAVEQINTLLSEIVVWTEASPYNATTSSGMLNAFTGYRKGFNGDLAQLLSYKASGGIAYINGLCKTNPAYSMSYAGINQTYLEIPVYSWTVEVITHELGHLMGSQHTHACVWNGNNTAIDGCYKVEGSCSDPGLPPSNTGGTIMSYCHLTQVGINFSNGFGTQPGNIIRSKVANAACLSACPGGNSGEEPVCNDISLKLEIKTDNYPMETTWKIKNAANVTVLSGGPYFSPNTLNTIDICLPDGCYNFVIYDEFGDGFCCNYGNGYYKLKKESTELVNGSTFGSTEQKSFCISKQNATCSDGIKNGQETGIDCGGPNCPPCPTCSDGIKNGTETGIDCGGPNCPPCPTCSDGIKNGTETGIDCGGPNCPPCPTCSDGIKNGQETGIDCGGPNCPPCPTCSDGIKNGTETGIDCGGPNCPPCPTCSDGIKNGTETGIDCGGPYCPPCPTCSDGIKNGTETGIDCGGPNCPPCPTCSDGIKNGTEIGIDCGGPNCPPCPTCSDGIKNGTETGIDCGGPNCPPCPTCSDGIKNGTETGIDCGGPNCPPCPTCSDGIKNGTETGIDCGGPNCPPCPTCSDGIKNGTETGIDCGGPNCPPCPTCSDGIKNGTETGIDCGGPNCPPCPTCSDGIKNGTETGIDCGGPNCPPCPTCSDGIKNGTETGIDCGGPNCPPCPTCSDGIKNGTETGIDCGGPNCPPCPTCSDGIKNGTETGIDCGGPNCPPCPTCSDGIKNGTETGIDCGGPNCPPCPTCSDGIKNGQETGIDCGGPNCPPCPTCSDGIKNGQETDIDCGGPNCPPCPTCSDGIKNGQETGIDCGGPNCPPCPTCSDGIKNGQETGIDCGGPNCPPCPTCSDGIKNGQETGIDCGGPNCPPCKIENGSETTLIGGYYFESGWDDWESSGSNSTRLKTAYSPEGSYSIQIKGNSSSSASMTSLLYDLSKYDTIAIEFRVRATGNNTGDGFSFRYFNGKSWITVQQYIFRQDYTNSLIYSKKIKLKGPLSKESQFRIQMNSENKSSHIYIDAVTIHGITSKSKTSCEDGIQNGLETGIDCGGPSCPPCNPDDVQDEVSLGGFFFETGWDGWNSGGAFSKRLKTAYSPEGSYSIQLKGNHNDASSMISPEFNSGSFDTVAIEFRLRSIHAKPGDKLIVKYFNGTSWIIVQEYLYPSDFSNSLKYTKNLILTGSLSNHSKLAIETQLYDEDSQIYVDAITITGHKKQLPTCTDGIHNGLETGIDCGGPSCSPCAGDEDDQEVMLAGYFFETGWDKWIGETQGTIRHTGVPSPEGSHCIHMNHPFGQSTFMTSEEFNLYPYKSLTVTFDFITQNMQDGERFMLQYYNGGRWITLNTFISGLDFVNDIPYNTTYHLNGILSTHAVFRIYKDVSAIQSTLYIDAVILKARNKESLTESPLEIRINGEKLRNEVSPDILIIPNPASDYISFITDEHIKSVKIYSTSGKLAFHIENEISKELDISDLVSGMYIVVIETAQNIYNKKLIKR